MRDIFIEKRNWGDDVFFPYLDRLSDIQSNPYKYLKYNSDMDSIWYVTELGVWTKGEYSTYGYNDYHIYERTQYLYRNRIKDFYLSDLAIEYIKRPITFFVCQFLQNEVSGVPTLDNAIIKNEGVKFFKIEDCIIEAIKFGDIAGRVL